MAWSEARIETLRRMWGEGASASQIALELNCGITRNGILGKVHRLGLSGRVKVPAPATPHQRRQREITARVTARFVAPHRDPKPEHKPVAVVAPRAARVVDYTEPCAARRVTITDLEHHHCRWPLGDPGADDFRYCGSDKADIGPYCGFHERMAYAPARERGARTAATRRDMVAV